MSSRHVEVEMEKQFLADLEKAKALSLETHELEKIRKQRFSQPDPSIYSESNNLEEYKQYLQRKAQLHQVKAGTTSLTGPPSSARRNSDTRNPLTSGDQPQRGKDEADLISFNPPPPVPNPQDEAHNNLKELVDKMHRMNTQQQYEHPVYKTQRSYSVASAPTYGGYTPAYLQQQIVPNYNPAAMQLVPYQQTTSDKPSKLTPDELARLYSMPTAYGVAPKPGFIPPGQYQPTNAYLPAHPQFPVQYAPVPTAYIPQGQPVAATVAPPAPGFTVQPTPPPPPTTTVTNPESALVHVPKLLTLANRSTSQPAPPSFPPAIPGPSSAAVTSSNPFARNSTGSTKTTSNGQQQDPAVVLRPKSDPPAARLGDNLIDLGPFEESSRVSVLEAFDPLLCGHRNSAGNSSSGASEDDKGRQQQQQQGGPRARGKW